MSNDRKERETILNSVLKNTNFGDAGLLALRQKLSAHFQLIADKGTSVDSGMTSGGEMDFLPTIDGKEYVITVKLRG